MPDLHRRPSDKAIYKAIWDCTPMDEGETTKALDAITVLLDAHRVEVKQHCPKCKSAEWFPGAACWHCGWEAPDKPRPAVDEAELERVANDTMMEIQTARLPEHVDRARSNLKARLRRIANRPWLPSVEELEKHLVIVESRGKEYAIPPLSAQAIHTYLKEQGCKPRPPVDIDALAEKWSEGMWPGNDALEITEVYIRSATKGAIAAALREALGEPNENTAAST